MEILQSRATTLDGSTATSGSLALPPARLRSVILRKCTIAGEELDTLRKTIGDGLGLDNVTVTGGVVRYSRRKIRLANNSHFN